MTSSTLPLAPTTTPVVGTGDAAEHLDGSPKKGKAVIAPTPPPDPTTGSPAQPTPYDDFRALLGPDLHHPADYWQRVAVFLSIFAGLIRRDHRHCDAPGCRTCAALADIVALAQAHNSLQTFNESVEVYQPHPLLHSIDTATGPTADHTAGATA